MATEPSSKNDYNDEIDLLVLFNYIGEKFNKLFRLIGWIFKSIYSIIIYSIRAIIVNLKIIAATIVLALITGYLLEKFTDYKYESEMLVRTYFDAKYQLATNINDYNALIRDKNYNELSTIFEIDVEDAKSIVEFEVYPGPETENDRIIEFDGFIRSLDSTSVHKEISFKEYVENRDIFSGNLYFIRVESFQKDIFDKLVNGISTSFENEYSLKKMEKRDSLIAIQQNTIKESINEIDSLQQVYINVLKEESKTTRAIIGLGEGIPLQEQKTETKEFQLLNQEIKLRDEFRKLEEQKVEESVFFDILSSFQRTGNRVTKLTNNYLIIVPALACLALCAIFLLKRLTTYVLKYEA